MWYSTILVLLLAMSMLRGSHQKYYLDVKENVYNVLVEQLDITYDQINLGSRIQADLGADSLGFVEIVLALEARFGIEIHAKMEYAEPSAGDQTLSTVNDFIEYIKARN